VRLPLFVDLASNTAQLRLFVPLAALLYLIIYLMVVKSLK